MIDVEKYINGVKIWNDVDPQKWDVDVSVKVQINQVGELINEVIARHQIEKIIREQDKIEDPSVW